MKKSFSIFTLSALVVLMVVGCKSKGSGDKAELSGSIKIDGSSTVFPITEAVAEEYRNEQPRVQVTSGVSGTGGGFKKFGIGEIDIANASRPIRKEELDLCEKNNIQFIELPVAYDGLAVVVSKENNFVDYLTVAELKKIWEPAAQNKIKSWKQVRSTFPDVPLNLYGAGTASGTFDYFTEAIVGEAKSSRGDYTASEDDNVLVQGVAGDKGALGYFGLAYYEFNTDKLKLVPIDDEIDENGKGPILPSIESVNNGTYQPLARPEFIYVSAKAAQRAEVQDFIRFYMENAAVLVKEVGYIPLTDEIYALALEHFRDNKLGTAFADRSPVGVNLVEVLKKMSE
jgi:phosphate transport system substrate-binding protein